MNFADTYQEFAAVRPVFSFEVFPPRTDKAMGKFGGIVTDLLELRPDFVTCTYGAMGSTRDKTIEIAGGVKADYGIDTACHLTCVGSAKADIDAILDDIAAAGVDNIVALRGDPPQGETAFKPVEGGYGHAIELVQHIRARGGFGVAVAGYPEKHLEASDLDTDLVFLKEKVDAGADVVITQLFYDNTSFFEFVDKARALGITCPIVPGIMPILSGKQIQRITSMCGASIPRALLEELKAVGDDTDASVEVGIRQAVDQVRELLDADVAGIHFYVLNRAGPMRQIFERLGLSH